MDSVLIISSSKKGVNFFKDVLSQNFNGEITAVATGGEARRLIVDRDFDLCIINAPLSDETGEILACDIVSDKVSQAILVVKSEIADEVSIKVEEHGVITLGKPMNRLIFWNSFKVANAIHNKVSKLKRENTSLIKKIEDIKMIDRAKCLLIEYLKMSECEAHRHIEKQAMDMRMTKRQISESIIKRYEI